MKRKKSTLRHFSPLAREIAQIANMIDSANRRLHRLSLEIQAIETENQVFQKIQEPKPARPEDSCQKESFERFKKDSENFSLDSI